MRFLEKKLVISFSIDIPEYVVMYIPKELCLQKILVVINDKSKFIWHKSYHENILLCNINLKF